MDQNNENASTPVSDKLSTENQNVAGGAELNKEAGSDKGLGFAPGDNGDDKNKNGKPSDKKDKKAVDKKNKKMNIFVYWLISILTFGLWNRFRPRKGGWKGSWLVTVIMLTLLSGALITERFFKAEFNQAAREQLQLEVDVLPEVLPFEEGKVSTKAELEAVKAEYDALIKDKDAEIQRLQDKLKNSTNSIGKEFGKLKETIALKDKLIAEQKQKIAELEDRLDAEATVSNITRTSILKSESSEATAFESAPLTVENVGRGDVAPLLTIEFSVKSLSEASKEVGCETKYSAERSQDVFNKEYAGSYVKWSGKVVDVNKDYVEIQAGDEAKAKVFFKTKGAGYYMVKGEEITMVGTVTSKASCDAPFVVTEAVQKK